MTVDYSWYTLSIYYIPTLNPQSISTLHFVYVTISPIHDIICISIFFLNLSSGRMLKIPPIWNQTVPYPGRYPIQLILVLHEVKWTSKCVCDIFIFLKKYSVKNQQWIDCPEMTNMYLFHPYQFFWRYYNMMNVLLIISYPLVVIPVVASYSCTKLSLH